MNYAQIQSFLGGRVSGDATLLPITGSPILVDPFQDPDEAKAAIYAQLAATGACVEIGFPWFSSPSTGLGGDTQGDATCEVFAAEHIKVPHSPSKAEFVTRVITACTKPPGMGIKPARLRSSESVKTEAGHILHMLSFYVPLNIRQP